MRYAAFLLCLPLLAQDLARLEGRVIDSEGKAVANATVMTGPMTNREPSTLRTAADGTFAFDGLTPASNYTVVAQKPGYLQAAPGAGASGIRNTPPPPFALAPGETARVELRMIPAGIITGTITTQNGDALPQAAVVLWQAKYRLGVMERSYVRVGRTDDRGVYRFADLPAGRYFVIAGEASAGTYREAQANFTTYFGGTQDISKATFVDITPGGEAHADIALSRGTVYTLRGKVLDASGVPLAQRSVSVRRNNDPAFTTVARGPTDAEGKFEIHDLVPGEYIVAMDARYDPKTSEQDPQLPSNASVFIAAADLNDFTVRASADPSIQGTIRVEDGEWSPVAQQPRIGASLSEQLLTLPSGIAQLQPSFAGLALPNSPITGSYATVIRADATFEIKGVAPGEYQFVAGGFPETYFVKSVRIGDNDVTHSPIRAPSGPLTVIVSTKGAEVAGTLPRDGLSVVLWPETENLGHPLHGIRVVNSTKGGAFRLPGLAPGTYRVAAFDASEPGVLWNYAFLNKFDGEAARVELTEGAKVTATPPLIPALRFNEEFKKLP